MTYRLTPGTSFCDGCAHEDTPDACLSSTLNCWAQADKPNQHRLPENKRVYLIVKEAQPDELRNLGH